ncbi:MULTISPECIES: hypothetical protein [Leptospira]|uniref:hypothetical protein n=1 Tax=Leptospira TaxID=171 RepID=UPI0002BF9804|nr:MULTISPECIES: hypothetical protein [Leptospira]EMN94766.1 hypothetical protein LEP1GSC110_3402 [Leptospira interrogans serovar Medanensis str. UT053]
MKFLICLFGGMSLGFLFSFFIESLNPNPHEGVLLFESFAWYSSIFLVGVCGLIAGRKRNE